MRISFTTPLLATLLLTGCGNGDKTLDTSTSSATTTTTTTTTTMTTTTTTTTTERWCADALPDCPIILVETHPPDQSTDVYHRTAIDFTFSHLSGSEDIRLTQAGLDVPGTATASAATGRLIFVPDAPLLTNTAYQVDNCTCKGEQSTHWTTNDIGTPTAAVDLTNRTYVADIGLGRFVEPVGFNVLSDLFFDTKILFTVTHADAAAITLLGGAEDGLGDQDTCAPTSAYTDNADFTQNPYFATQTATYHWYTSDVPTALTTVEITGSFAADGSAIHGGTLTGNVDMSAFDLVVGGNTCELLEVFSTPCGPCPTGPDTCIDLLVDSLTMQEVPGLILEERTAFQIGNDPRCTP